MSGIEEWLGHLGIMVRGVAAQSPWNAVPLRPPIGRSTRGVQSYLIDADRSSRARAALRRSGSAACNAAAQRRRSTMRLDAGGRDDGSEIDASRTVRIRVRSAIDGA